MYNNNSNTVSVPVQAPATMQPSNESMSLIEWAAHQQAIWQAAADSPASKEWLVATRYADVDPDEVFSAALSDLRSGLVEPIVRLTSEQMDAIEDERPGEDYSTHPYLY